MSCSSSSEEDEGREGYRKGGYHAVRPGDPFGGGRYIAQRKLGWGNFSTVWLAYDVKFSFLSFSFLLLRGIAFFCAFLLCSVHFWARDPVLSDCSDICEISFIIFSFQLFPFCSCSCVAALIQDLRFVALKIQRSATDFAQAALHEIDVLTIIANGDPSNSKCIIRLLDHFKHSGPNGQHLCMVFEFLGDSLLRLIRYNRYRGIELNKVKEICVWVLVGLDYLHRELGIIHADLKPENILLVSTINPSMDPIRSGCSPILERPEGNLTSGVAANMDQKLLKKKVRKAAGKMSKGRGLLERISQKGRSLDGIDFKCKIVDFGNACWVDRKFAEDIQTRHYRAPEVILGASYSFPVDMWSLACILFELATGDMLFAPKTGQGFDEDEHGLAGPPCYDDGTPGKDSKKDLKRIKRLKFVPLERLLLEKYKFSNTDAHEFAAFLCPLLDFAQEKRPTAAQCLQHPWVKSRSGKTNYEYKELAVEQLEVGMNKIKLAN
ncbi:hypothetical protein ACLOJK_002430 [Asimina triloba]